MLYMCNKCKNLYVFTKSEWYRNTVRCTKCDGTLVEVTDSEDMSELVSEEK